MSALRTSARGDKRTIAGSRENEGWKLHHFGKRNPRGWCGAMYTPEEWRCSNGFVFRGGEMEGWS